MKKIIKIVFQIKKTKDFIRREQVRIWKSKEGHKEIIKALEIDLKDMEKCRQEINEANKLLREL